MTIYKDALLAAGRLLADKTGSCPADSEGWEHPGGCGVMCRIDCEAECWCMYAKYMADANLSGGKTKECLA